MTDLPKFEDVFRFKIISSTSKIRDIRIGWEACMSACEPIIAGLEKELADSQANFTTAYRKANELEDQLYEKEGEISDAEEPKDDSQPAVQNDGWSNTGDGANNQPLL